MPRIPRGRVSSRASGAPGRRARPHSAPPAPAKPLPYFQFLGGKGGVGKTTCAAAIAVAAAETGERVLIVSTDPAHSLGDAFGQPLSARPRRIATARGTLTAIELDATKALKRWLAPHRADLVTIGERGTYLDREDVAALLDSSLPGATELLALDELSRVAAAGVYDRVIVDTAPAGHTLRLLTTPDAIRQLARILADMQAKHQVLVQSISRTYERDACDALIEDLDRRAQQITALLSGAAGAGFVWVMVPEPLSVRDSAEGIAALTGHGIRVAGLIVNRMTPRPPGPCAHCDPRRREEHQAVADVRRTLGHRVPAIRFLAASPDEPVGVPALRRFGRGAIPLGRRGPRKAGVILLGASSSSSLDSVRAASRASKASDRGKAYSRPAVSDSSGTAVLPILNLKLAFFGGKGGVGKTTCATAAALAVSHDSRRRVLLLSIDPAHSVRDLLAIEGTPERTPERTPDLKVGPTKSVTAPERTASAKATAVKKFGRAKNARDAALPSNLTVLELDANAEFQARREEFQAGVDAVFDGLRGDSRFDATYDRVIVRELLDLAPPGIDQIFAILTIMDVVDFDPGALPRQPAQDSTAAASAAAYDLVIVDAAASGHLLELIELLSHARRWVTSLMSVLLRYRGVTGLGQVAQDLVRHARRLRILEALLSDPSRCGFIIVARSGLLARAETVRLLRELRRHRAPVRALLFNALTPPACARCRRQSRRDEEDIAALLRESRRLVPKDCSTIRAPAGVPPPAGINELRSWQGTWTLS